MAVLKKIFNFLLIPIVTDHKSDVSLFVSFSRTFSGLEFSNFLGIYQDGGFTYTFVALSGSF